MKKFTTTVEFIDGRRDTVNFNSYHSASRFFASLVCDYGISVVTIVDENAIEVAKWVNVR